jgi:hypothetical protein
VTGAVFGLAASLITFRGLWAAAEILPPLPPLTVVSDEEGDGQEAKDTRAVVKEAEPYAVESDEGVSGSTSSYVEVKPAQA